jgi:hypothetical protein
VPRRTPAPGGGEVAKRYYDVMEIEFKNEHNDTTRYAKALDNSWVKPRPTTKVVSVAVMHGDTADADEAEPAT